MWTRVSYFARETLVSLRRNVLMTIAGIITVAVSLSLFGGILLLSKWVDHGTEKIKGGATLEIFMNTKASQQQIDGVAANLRSDPNVRSVRHLTKPDAFAEFKRIFRRQPDLVGSITEKDLPESFRVTPKKAELTDTVKAEFSTQQGVDQVSTPGDSLKGVIDATGTARAIFVVMSVVLLASSLFLIVNTIRLATFARRREIEVMKLVGASNWFVRIPFIAEGMVQGLVGAGVAIGAVLLLKFQGFDHWFLGQNNFFSEFYVETSDATYICFLVLVIGSLIGIVGAGIGLRRFLRP
jgi:cell division transport system permease protein